MNKQILDLLFQIFEVCIIPLLGVLTGYFIKYMDAKVKEAEKKTEQLENEEHQKLIQKYLEMAEDTVTKCVIATNQTFVDSLKKKREFTEEAWAEAFQKTRNAVKTILAGEAEKYLEEAIGDVNVYLTNLIEAAVVANKLEK